MLLMRYFHQLSYYIASRFEFKIESQWDQTVSAGEGKAGTSPIKRNLLSMKNERETSVALSWLVVPF